MTHDEAVNAAKNQGESRQHVSFFLDEEEYGIEILKVQEIIRFAELTRIPQSPPFIEGVLNLRGKVVPVMDLRTRFSMPRAERDRSTRIIVVDVANKVMGMIVDAVSGVLQIEDDQIAPPPPMGSKIDTDYIQGMARIDDRLMILLDVDKILSTDELAAID